MLDKDQLTKKLIKLQKQLNSELVELAALKQKSAQLSVVYDDVKVRDEKSNTLAKELLDRQKELNCMLDRAVGQLSTRKEAILQTSDHFAEIMNELPASFKNKLNPGFERIQKLENEFSDEDFKFFEENISRNENEGLQEIVEDNHEEIVCKQQKIEVEEVLEVLEAEEMLVSEPYVDKLNDLIELIFDDECRLSLDIVPDKSLVDELDNSFMLKLTPFIPPHFESLVFDFEIKDEYENQLELDFCPLFMYIQKVETSSLILADNFSLEEVENCISISSNLELQLDMDRAVDINQLELIFNPDSILRLVVERGNDLNTELDSSFVLELIPFKAEPWNSDSTLMLDLQINEKKQTSNNPKLITNSIGSIPSPSKPCLKCGQACRLYMSVCPHCYGPLDAKSVNKEKIKSRR